MAGLLGDVFSFGDTLKRKAKGLLADPVGTLQQFVGNENDRAGRLNELTYAAAAEQGMGPQSKKLAGLLADSYSPTGMFIGATAKTWDKAAAEKAKTLLAKGVDPKQVWKETGTFKGADGALRQEIDDSLASIKTSALPTKEINGQRYPSFKLADAMEHRSLFDAYPDTQGIEQSFQVGRDVGGTYREGMDWISLSDKFQKKVPVAQDQQRIDAAYNEMRKFNQQPRTKRVDALMDGIVDKEGYGSPRFERVVDRYVEPIEAQRGLLGRAFRDAQDNANANPRSEFVLSPNAKSTQLHEIQHAIQQREGWAKGGSPETLQREIDAANAIREKVRYAVKQAGLTDDPIAQSNWYQEAAHYGKKVPQELNGLSAEDAYMRLAGEAEARATQARMNMNAAQRREVYPFDSWDVPLDQLIVRR